MLEFAVRYPESDDFFWNENYQFLYVLSGTVRISTGLRTVDMRAEDYVLVNPFETCLLESAENASLLCMQMDASEISKSVHFPKERVIDCCSVRNIRQTEEQLQNIRVQFANLFLIYSRENNASSLKLNGEALIFFQHLFDLFSVDLTESEYRKINRSSVSYLRDTIQYIHNNYQKDARIGIIANQIGVSANHLERCLRTGFGKSFGELLLQYRLKHAAADMEAHPDSTITDISYSNGFSNPSYFIGKFKDLYGITPSRYRRDWNRKSADRSDKPEETKNVSMFESITKYAHAEKGKGTLPGIARRYGTITCDSSDEGTAVDPFWKKIVCINTASDGLSGTVQNQIRTAQKEIGFEYIRFHGIFDDDMLFYSEDSDGNPLYNYVQIDELLDFLCSVGLKPYIEFSYMPGALAEDPDRYDLFRSHISMPADWNKWEAMLRNFLEHCVWRYGLTEVRSWRFTPFMSNNILYGFFSWQDYIRMWQHAYTAVKDTDRELMIGGPGIDASVLIRDFDRTFRPWIETCIREQYPPDFITLKDYPYDHTKEEKEIWNKARSGIRQSALNMLDDEDYLANDIQETAQFLKPYGFEKEDIVIEAWNATYSRQDPCNDICFKSAFLVKNVIENQHKIRALAYWCLSDNMADFTVVRKQQSFRGDFGLITYDGIRKSGYYALTLLNQLKGKELCSGKGYFISRDRDTYYVLLYQFCKYNKFHAAEPEFSSKIDNPYDYCQEGERIEQTFCISGVENGSYSIEQYQIGPEKGGNPYEQWVSMGKPYAMNRQQQAYLTAHSDPEYRIDQIPVTDHRIELTCRTGPHEVQLMKIWKR